MLSARLAMDSNGQAATLETLSLKYLFDGNLTEAFKCADRRCRVPPVAEARHYTFRAEISYRMNYRKAALTDLMRAVELEPDNLSANRRLLAWANNQEKIAAAERLLTTERDTKTLVSAISTLRRAGRKAFAAIRYTDLHVAGWAAWATPERARVTVASGADNTSNWLTADPAHPWQLKTCGPAILISNVPVANITACIGICRKNIAPPGASDSQQPLGQFDRRAKRKTEGPSAGQQNNDRHPGLWRL